MLTGFIAACVAFAVFLVANLCLFHFRDVRARVNTMTLIYLACCPLAYLLFDALRPLHADSWLPEGLQAALLAGLIFWLGWGAYMQFYFLFSRSITARITMEFMDSGKETLSIEEVQELYSFRQIVRDRIGQLVASGLLSANAGPEGTTYVLTEKGQRMGSVFWAVKDFMRFGKGG